VTVRFVAFLSFLGRSCVRRGTKFSSTAGDSAAREASAVLPMSTLQDVFFSCYQAIAVTFSFDWRSQEFQRRPRGVENIPLPASYQLCFSCEFAIDEMARSRFETDRAMKKAISGPYTSPIASLFLLYPPFPPVSPLSSTSLPLLSHPFPPTSLPLPLSPIPNFTLPLTHQSSPT